mgnify:CR=1 FL=1
MKISYRKNWDKEGVCYNQTITFTNSLQLLESINNKIDLTLKTIVQKRVLTGNDLKLKMYLKPLNKGLNFTTHTQRDFVFSAFLGEKIKDRNTILIFK